MKTIDRALGRVLAVFARPSGSVGLAGAVGARAVAGAPSVPGEATFVVTDDSGAPSSGATVYLVPAADVDGDAVHRDGRARSGAAADRDEPLEDQVRLNGSSYPHATTGANGMAFVQGISEGDYFWYVDPAAGDTEHLPGGTGCRIARNTAQFLVTTVSISLSVQARTDGDLPRLEHVPRLPRLARHAVDARAPARFREARPARIDAGCLAIPDVHRGLEPVPLRRDVQRRDDGDVHGLRPDARTPTSSRRSSRGRPGRPISSCGCGRTPPTASSRSRCRTSSTPRTRRARARSRWASRTAARSSGSCSW